MKKILPLVSLSLVLLSFGSCKKETGSVDGPQQQVSKDAPDGFSYQTTKAVDVNVRLLSRSDQPLGGVMVSIFHPSATGKGKELTKIISDKNGYVKAKLNLPGSLDTLIIDPAYVGLIRNAKAYIKGGNLTAIIGGQSGFSGNIVIKKTADVTSRDYLKYAKLGSTSAKGISTSAFESYKPGDYDESGRPKVLEKVDPFDFELLLKQINAALPEGQVVNSKYIATHVPSDIRIERLADVWITFVHEGADYRNSLAYYTYPTGKPPVSEDEITEAHLIFPNCSSYGDRQGGQMLLGDKVKIGRFPAGTSIGFMLLQNAYGGAGSIDFNATKFFSTEGLNPESDPRLKRHNVVLHNVLDRTFLIGFDDIDRTPKNGGDNDFNDLVFYAQSNPVEAISPVDVPVLDEKFKDSDEDGIPDLWDEYPEDKTRAYNRYYPSQDVWGTTTFEDNWPNEGDYDLNDLVVSYRYKFAMSPSNQLVDLTAEYKPLAAGADYQTGFGVQLPFDPSQVKSVTGYNVAGHVKLDGKGLESNQSKAVIIPFDNYRNLFGANATQVNTTPGAPKLDGKPVTVKVLLNSPLSDDYITDVPFNPFIISNLERGREVHLVNQAPTDLADTKLFKTGADDSNPKSGRYYLTNSNRPFAIDFFGPFSYPTERNAIYNAYIHFAEWAKSGGAVYPDWYLNEEYRNPKLIYK